MHNTHYKEYKNGRHDNGTILQVGGQRGMTFFTHSMTLDEEEELTLYNCVSFELFFMVCSDLMLAHTGPICGLFRNVEKVSIEKLLLIEKK